VLVRIFYSLLQVFVVMPFAPLGEGAVIQLKEIVRSNYGRRLRRSRRDVWKTLCNVETISDHRSRDFRDAPHVACATPVFVAPLIPALTSNPLLFVRMDDVLAGRLVFGKFFAALTAVNTANTSDRKSASPNRVRVPRFPLEFVFTGFVLPAQIVAGSIVPRKHITYSLSLVERRSFLFYLPSLSRLTRRKIELNCLNMIAWRSDEPDQGQLR
jgi:hypothetical protein